eukprot:scaffold30269_cov20-Prasinocladus_malaysianus.AAC.1
MKIRALIDLLVVGVKFKLERASGGVIFQMKEHCKPHNEALCTVACWLWSRSRGISAVLSLVWANWQPPTYSQS